MVLAYRQGDGLRASVSWDRMGNTSQHLVDPSAEAAVLEAYKRQHRVDLAYDQAYTIVGCAPSAP